MPWYLYLALKQLFPSGRFFSFFSLMSIIGVMLGVGVLIIVQSVMNGMGNEIRSLIVDTTGDIRIESRGILDDWRPVAVEIEQRADILGVTPYAEGIVMLEHRGRPAFPYLRGIDPVREGEVMPLEDFLFVGGLEDLYDGSVFLSEGLAHSLGAGPGDVVEVYTPLMLDRLENDEVLLPRELEVAGLYRTGWNQIDGNTMITTLRLMQELYGMEDGIHGLTVRIDRKEDALQLAAEIDETLPADLSAVSWYDSQRDFLFILKLEKTVISFIIIFIILVASFSIAIALMMTVIRKTREIGLLVAMGGTPMQVAGCFCLQGFVIGVTGTVLGFLFAVVSLHYRSPILRAVAWITDSSDAILHFYGFLDFPVQYLANDFGLVAVFAIVISTLAGLLPAWRAARLKPADALRSE